MRYETFREIEKRHLDASRDLGRKCTCHVSRDSLDEGEWPHSEHCELRARLPDEKTEEILRRAAGEK